MYPFIFKYYKHIVILLLIYLILILIRNIFNFNTILILLLIFIFFYNTKIRLFKKIVYKLIFKRRNRFSFKNKYIAAQNSLKSIEEIAKKINNQLDAESLKYEKNKLQEQLKYGDYNVTLFGAGSSGKTSIARALLKSLVGKTSAMIGTTQEITSYKIRIPILKRNINIIDTPGLFEASRQGEQREKTTIIEASRSDLILFVLDQDINKYELYLITKLSELSKKIIIVLNKCDLRSDKQNDIIQKNIISITSEKQIQLKLVKTIAYPKLLPNNALGSSKFIPNVNNLFIEIIKTLDENGEELLADNILLRCNKLGLISKKVIFEQRSLIANKVINKYTWITGGLVLVNPISVIDFIATTSVNVQMILEISKIYNVKITKKQAVDLSKSLLSTLAKLGIMKGSLSVITTALSSNFTTIFISKFLQSITSCWLIRIVGLSIIEYFNNGQNWGDGGIQEVIEDIYKLNKREDILNKFVIEAINKLKIKDNRGSKDKLPPYFSND